MLILILFLRCSGVNSSYVDNSIAATEKFKNEVLKKLEAEKENYSIIDFTDYFLNNTIILSNSKGVFFNKEISTVESLGYAFSARIDNDFETVVYDKSNNYKFIIPINKYKFIYISREKNKKKYKILYSNVLHGYR